MEIDIAVQRVSSTQLGGATSIEELHGLPEFLLPEVDGGGDVWLFLAACFAVEVLVW
jgi:hypothetical protein